MLVHTVSVLYCAHLCLKCSLGISNFLEEISSLFCSIVFLYFFALITQEGFLISPCYSLKLHSEEYIVPFLLYLFLLFFSQQFVSLPQTTILPFCISFSWGLFWSPLPVQSYEALSIVLQSLCLSDLIPWIYLSLPLYSCKGFDLGHTSIGSQRFRHNWSDWACTHTHIPEWSSGFPYFLPFKSEFGNKEFMIWATVSSWSCFCWLYTPSSSLAAKNIINLIFVLTIRWHPCVESSLVLLEEGIFYDQCVLLAKLCCLCPASFCTPRLNLPVTLDISWLPTFAFQSPTMKRTSFWGVSSRSSCRSS